MGPEGGGGRIGAARAWAGWWVVSAALWLLLVDNTHVPEMVAGAGVATLAASAAVAVRQQRRVVLRPRARWLLRLWHPVLVAYPRDTWLLVLALFRRRPGRFVTVPPAATADDPRSAAELVLQQTAASFSPNTYVIGTDVDADAMLVHRLVDRGREAALSDADPLRLR
jgi:multisubunit Na+/H+ antiporter MnhE subunit